MKKIVILLIYLTVFAATAGAEVIQPPQTGMAPRPDELFAPLLGDPRELHFALRYLFLDGNVTAAEVAVGHYYGIYRWALPKNIGAVQLNIGGGIFPRFKFSENKDLQVIDFYANVPLDIRINKWSGRFMLYHVSSHLGDDYIRTTGQIADSNSWNSIRSILSYDANAGLRLYGGYTYNLQVHPAEQGLWAYQSGFEVSFNIFGKSYSQAYWANDLQWWERTDYKPQFNSQIGVKTGLQPKDGRGIYYFLEYTTGPEYYGQFFLREETCITLGMHFAIN
jgi:hypothetical protein